MASRAPLTVKLEPHLWEKVSVKAAWTGKRPSDVVNEALERYFEEEFADHRPTLAERFAEGLDL